MSKFSSLKRPSDDDDHPCNKSMKTNEQNNSVWLLGIFASEIWLKILAFCSFWDFARFGCCCKSAHNIFIRNTHYLPECYFGKCSSNHQGRLTSQLLTRLPIYDLEFFPGNKLFFTSYLTGLRFKRDRENIDMSQFTHLNLLHLRIEGDNNILGLEKVTTLTYLSLLNVETESANEMGIESLTNLRHLGSPAYMDEELLYPLTNLRTLILGEMDQSGDFEKEAVITNLQYLDFRYIEGDLNHLTKLTFLELDGNDLNSSSDFKTCISNLDSLKALSLISFDNIEPLDLDLPKNLLSLEFDTCKITLQHVDLPNLERLSIKDESDDGSCSVKLTSFSQLMNLTSLTALGLEKDELTILTNLQQLELCDGEYDLDNLQKLTKLKLGDYVRFNFSDLPKLTNLLELSVRSEGLPMIDIPPLSTVTKLELACTIETAQVVLDRCIPNLGSLKRFELDVRYESSEKAQSMLEAKSEFLFSQNSKLCSIHLKFFDKTFFNLSRKGEHVIFSQE